MAAIAAPTLSSPASCKDAKPRNLPVAPTSLRTDRCLGKFNQERLAALLTGIRDWNLFLAFNIADGCTKGKSREPLRWLLERIVGKVESKFTEVDIV